MNITKQVRKAERAVANFLKCDKCEFYGSPDIETAGGFGIDELHFCKKCGERLGEKRAGGTI